MEKYRKKFPLIIKINDRLILSFKEIEECNDGVLATYSTLINDEEYLASIKFSFDILNMMDARYIIESSFQNQVSADHSEMFSSVSEVFPQIVSTKSN